MSDVIDQFARVVGEQHVITDPQVLQSLTTDWSGRYSGPALCAVRPGDVEEVSAIVRLCGERDVPIVPQGGNTGLVGGSVPGPNGPLPVVVSTTRLDRLDPVDPISGQVTVGAGVRLAALQAHARKAGWEYGVDLGARDSATVGGTVATNAGGIDVVANGMTRAQLVGVEAVLPDASVLSHMTGLLKDNTGLDLAALLCGSEGTLGIITAVRVRLLRPPARRSTALVGVPDITAALTLLQHNRGRNLLAAEMMDSTSMELVTRFAELPYPLAARHDIVVLLEIADEPTSFVLAADADAVVAVDASDRARLWRYREVQGEAYSALGIVHRFDVSLPLDVIARWVQDVSSLVRADARVRTFGFFGHLADGNLHLEIFGPPADDQTLDHLVLESVANAGGSISAEHGIGRAKAPYLSMARSAAEIAAMQAIKDAWDPAGLMNPGVLFAAKPGSG